MASAGRPPASRGWASRVPLSRRRPGPAAAAPHAWLAAAAQCRTCALPARLAMGSSPTGMPAEDARRPLPSDPAGAGFLAVALRANGSHASRGKVFVFFVPLTVLCADQSLRATSSQLRPPRASWRDGVPTCSPHPTSRLLPPTRRSSAARRVRAVAIKVDDSLLLEAGCLNSVCGAVRLTPKARAVSSQICPYLPCRLQLEAVTSRSSAARRLLAAASPEQQCSRSPLPR